MTNGSADNQRTAEELQNDVKQNKYVLVLFGKANNLYTINVIEDIRVKSK